MRRGAEGRVYCGELVGGGSYHSGPHRWSGHGEGRCSCDGRCGPSNGCQCRRCYEATFADERRRYCGRRVGRAGYHQGPHRWDGHSVQRCTCDGRCGPNNGCQCLDCYRLSFPGDFPSPPAEPTPAARGAAGREGELTGPSAASPPPGAAAAEAPQAQQAHGGGGMICCTCLAAEVNTCLVPCGHMCVCLSCSEGLGPRCPICRGGIVQVVRTFAAGADAAA
uniref:RING-type domain-containing protein n=1 Tax=Alexandrium monilatum TaxID=311494 RepID=A0A7S4S9A7_9DINO|mmetsp:Transcript_45479/g.142580  ORF Transcript_45479/g.142580 Transcript_45479/m.142580 type:complete len:222 (+) Transcript_45479:84-749(+)